MTDSQREQILSNVKYLRNVRPIDPDEISEYVTNPPHPAVVRQVIRDAAVELGLVERDDGTFVPVSGDPIEPGFSGVSSLPIEYSRALEDLLTAEFGPNWFRGDAGERLRDVIRQTKEQYFQQHPVEYDRAAALGYAIYHLPDYYAAVQYVIDELVDRGLLDHHLRILDVGAGVGGPALGIHDYLPDDALVEYHAIEPSDASEILESLLDETGKNFHWEIHREMAESFDPHGSFDLLLFGNVLSELDDPVAVVERYLPHLAEDGSLVALAPADLNTATQLRTIERTFSPTYTVYSPTIRLWPGYEPSDRGWSFDVKPDLDVPSFQQRLDDGSGEFVNVDVQYAYLILRMDDERHREFRGSERWLAKMADSDDHVTKRVNLAGVKLSDDLSESGERPLVKIGDGSEQDEHFAVLVHRTTLNESLVESDYGDILSFEGVLVLWNDDEGAYNLVVDEETVVERVA